MNRPYPKTLNRILTDSLLLINVISILKSRLVYILISKGTFQPHLL
jgi:hypothetical protein